MNWISPHLNVKATQLKKRMGTLRFPTSSSLLQRILLPTSQRKQKLSNGNCLNFLPPNLLNPVSTPILSSLQLAEGNVLPLHKGNSAICAFILIILSLPCIFNLFLYQSLPNNIQACLPSSLDSMSHSAIHTIFPFSHPLVISYSTLISLESSPIYHN